MAKAIARVIAEKSIEGDGQLARLDALGKASARTAMVGNMWPELMDEATAACAAYPDPVFV